MTSTLRHAIRRCGRRPAFTATAVLALALGIGAATAMFSVVQAVLFRTPPWPDAQRLAVIHAVRPDQRSNPAVAATWNRAPISWAAWQDLRKSSAFADVGVWMSQEQIFGSDRSDLVTVYYASSSFLSVLGVTPTHGRRFTPDEDENLSDAVIVSHETWQRRFGGRPDVIGQTTTLAYTHSIPSVTKRIVGVLPPTFQFQGQSPEFLLPMGLMAFNGGFETNRLLRAVGRLAPYVSFGQAQAIAEPLVRRFDPPDRRTARVVSLIEDRFGPFAYPLWVLFAGAGLLLAIGCSTLTGLLLVDGNARRSEMAVRVALGATRRQLAQQLALESLLLASTASAAGVLLAHWFTRVVVAMAPAAIQEAESISVNFPIAVWSWCLSSATAFLFALGPALAFSAPATSTVSAPSRGGHAHRSIVAVQLALAFVLVSCAGLFAQTLRQLRSTPLGFEPERVAVATVRLRREPVASVAVGESAAGNRHAGDRAALERRLNTGWMHTNGLLERLAALPGAVAAAGASVVPFTRPAPVADIRQAGGAFEEHQVQWHTVTEDYFRVMGIPVVRGRGFLRSDRGVGTPYWTVVSKEEERHLTPGVALGKEVIWDGYPFRIVGVVGEVQQQEASDERLALPALYVVNFRAWQINHFLVRTSGDPRSLLPAIRHTIQEYDGSLQVTATETMSRLVAESMRDERFLALLSAAFGAAALALAGVGLLGLTSYMLAMRRQEIAVRMALGAGARDVRLLVLRDAALVVGIGIGAGVPAAFCTFHVIRSLLFGVATTPVGVWLSALTVVIVATAAAVAAPVMRAGQVDAAELLRSGS